MENVCVENYGQNSSKEPMNLKNLLKNWWNGNLSGRCSLQEYWVTMLIGFISLVVFEVVVFAVMLNLVFSFREVLSHETCQKTLFTLMFLLNVAIFAVTVKPTFALICRRLFDFGFDISLLRRGIFLPLIGLLPILSLLIPGNKKENKFGLPSPYCIDIRKFFIGLNTPINELAK